MLVQSESINSVNTKRLICVSISNSNTYIISAGRSGDFLLIPGASATVATINGTNCYIPVGQVLKMTFPPGTVFGAASGAYSILGYEF